MSTDVYYDHTILFINLPATVVTSSWPPVRAALSNISNTSSRYSCFGTAAMKFNTYPMLSLLGECWRRKNTNPTNYMP